ncbi:GPS-CTERM domain-containing protein, partial [Streptomyces sp. NPDC005568]|uniref:GPS-CTERM domain-containing protein n=1 Tax=Streptomyces sp. NPDC005568 TaxID=3156887 RepID=UPI0033A77AB1
VDEEGNILSTFKVPTPTTPQAIVDAIAAAVEGCAIAGYPRTGCGEQVAAGDPDSSARPRSASESGSGGSGPSAGLLAGLAAVAALGAAAIWQARRRRH